MRFLILNCINLLHRRKKLSCQFFAKNVPSAFYMISVIFYKSVHPIAIKQDISDTVGLKYLRQRIVGCKIPKIFKALFYGKVSEEEITNKLYEFSSSSMYSATATSVLDESKNGFFGNEITISSAIFS